MSDLIKLVVAGICAMVVTAVVGTTAFAVLYLAIFAAVIVSSISSVILSELVHKKRLLLVGLFAMGAFIVAVPALAEPIYPIPQSGPPPPFPGQPTLESLSKSNDKDIKDDGSKYPDLCLGHWGCTLAASGGGLSDFAPVITEHHDVMNASYVFIYNALMLVPASGESLDGFFTNSISLRVNTSLCDVQQCWMHVAFDTDYPLEFVRIQGILTMNVSDYTLNFWPSVRFTFPARNDNTQLTVQLVTCISRLEEDNPCIHWPSSRSASSTKSPNVNLDDFYSFNALSFRFQ